MKLTEEERRAVQGILTRLLADETAIAAEAGQAIAAAEWQKWILYDKYKEPFCYPIRENADGSVSKYRAFDGLKVWEAVSEEDKLAFYRTVGWRADALVSKRKYVREQIAVLRRLLCL